MNKEPDINEIEQMLRKVASTHLSDDELNIYFDKVLGDEIDMARVEGHLKRCQICSRRYKMMEEVLEPSASTHEEIVQPSVAGLPQEFPQPSADRFRGVLAGLSQAFHEWWRKNFPESVGQALVTEGADAAKEDKEEKVFSEIRYGDTRIRRDKEVDIIIRWSVRDELDTGDLVISLASPNETLVSTHIEVSIGNMSKVLVMKKKRDEIVGDVTFTNEERKALPKDVEVLLKIAD